VTAANQRLLDELDATARVACSDLLGDNSVILSSIVKMASPPPTCPSHSHMTYKSIHPTSLVAMK